MGFAYQAFPRLWHTRLAAPGLAAAIEPTHSPAQVIEWFPATRPVFEDYGFGLINNPVLCRTMARRVTLGQVARMHGAPLAEFLWDLNRAAYSQETGQFSRVQ